MRIFRLGGIIAVLLLVSLAVMHAQLVQEFKPPRANCCLASTAQSFANQLKRYALMTPIVQVAIEKAQK